MSLDNAITEDLLELDKYKALARSMAYLAIGNAETEAELGCVTESTFDSMLDIFYAFPDDAELRNDCLAARKAMRQNEWGIEFIATVFDLELDPEWQDN